MQIENEHTFSKVVTTGINLFLGAGFSVLAKNTGGHQIPVGSALQGLLTQEFDLPEDPDFDLPKISSVLESTRATEFREYLKGVFQVGDFDSRYYSLQRLSVANIFSLNIDDLVHRIYEDSREHYLNDLDVYGPSDKTREAVNYVALHGCVQHPDRPLSFSSRDISAAFSQDQDRWHALTGRLQQFPTLFWGTQLADSDVLEALHPMTVRERQLKDRWMVCRTGVISEAMKSYFQSLGFLIIESTTDELLDYFGDVQRSDTKVSRAETPSTRELFGPDSIPDPASVALRPVIAFYQGAAPLWSDIFSQSIPTTKHLGAIVNSIHSGNHTLVLGVPACGKTTLLMQAASRADYDGHKIVCQSPTAQQVHLMARKLDGAKALICIDDFTDSVNAFTYLAQYPNITLVGADRYYNYDIVSHKLENLHRGITPLDVTSLDEADEQRIIEAIPETYRVINRREMSSVSDGTPPSIFEIIENSLKMPTLRSRYAKVVRQLESQDPNLLDFLLICCYVHNCRTPVSLDMLLSYFHRDGMSHDQVYDLKDQLTNMVTEYLGDLTSEGEQDYYVPRSANVAQAVLEQVSPLSLKRMLTRFHEDVSRVRICRYDIFKRRAFDKDIVLRAFPVWTQGQEFYRQAYYRDDTPYLLQQGALYLAHLKRFVEAFRWIEDAITQSDGRITSIRISHAMILFMANRDKDPSDPIVRQTLQDSMSILAECYQYDKRKRYHSIKFAEQALEYREIFNDQKSSEYLQMAEKWLADEKRLSPWHRYIRRLHRRVNSLLSGASRR